MRHLKTTKLFLLLSLMALPAYAEEFDESSVAPIIKKERERAGERIYGLDNMIAPAARRMALEVKDEAFIPNSATTKKMDEETALEAERDEALRREIAREEFLKKRAAREEEVREAARNARQGEALEVFPADDLPDSYYEQRGLRKPAPVQSIQQMGRRAPIAEPSIGQRVSGFSEQEAETEAPPAAPKKYGYWDRPMPERKPIEMPAPVRPSRLTERVAPAPEYVSNSWDDLNSARERARQAIAESVEADQAERTAPVNMPANSYGQPISKNWKNELAQVENSLSPQQAAMGPTSFMPFGQSAGNDALSDEVKEVEKAVGFGTQRLLSNIQTEHGTNELRERDPEDVPLLRPRFRTTKKLSKKQRRALAKMLKKNRSVRGSRPTEMVREGESYAAAKLPARQPNFYRHLDNDLPSRARGKNVRVHSIGNPED